MHISKFQIRKKGWRWAALIVLPVLGIGGGALFLPSDITRNLALPLREIAGIRIQTDTYPLRIILPGADPLDPPPQMAQPSSAGEASENLAALPATIEPPDQTGSPELVVTNTSVSIEEKLVPALPVPDETPRLAAKTISPPSFSESSFDLRGGPDAPDTIEVEKTVRFAGSDVGKVTVRIDKNARIYARGQQLASILPAASARPAVIGDEYVTLDLLRKAGFDIQYDAIDDKIILAIAE